MPPLWYGGEWCDLCNFPREKMAMHTQVLMKPSPPSPVSVFRLGARGETRGADRAGGGAFFILFFSGVPRLQSPVPSKKNRMSENSDGGWDPHRIIIARGPYGP